mgnify:CR=1 FL=1
MIKFFPPILLALAIAILTHRHCSEALEPDGTLGEAVVLTGGQIWPVHQTRNYHANRCQVKLQADGNFLVKRMVGLNDWQMHFQTSWHTSAGPVSDGNYYAKLDEHDGSLIVYRISMTDDNQVTYTSNIGDPESIYDLVVPLPREHMLVINENCILKLYRGTDDHKKELWTNNRANGLVGEPGISDYLQKGEMFHMNVCERSCNGRSDYCYYHPNALLLQHDCNLIQFRGRDMADFKEDPVVLWSSGSKRHETIPNCYLYEDEDTLRLYAGTLDKSLAQFEPRGDPVLWVAPDDFQNPCGGGYEVLLVERGGLLSSC